ncbi:hypothetical protein UPYG_G00140450 [Umbra pygmaea]|uniref:Uncharacterized protein n=1 Tax=Umbra pygmaea TaxID=75934 RepID=A0ABD0XK66_UMBPY
MNAVTSLEHLKAFDQTRRLAISCQKIATSRKIELRLIVLMLFDRMLTKRHAQPCQRRTDRGGFSLDQ